MTVRLTGWTAAWVIGAAVLASNGAAWAQASGGDIVVTGRRTPQQIAVSNQFRNKVEDIRNAGEENKGPDWDLFLGAGAGYSQVALGSDERTAGGVPLVDFRYKDRFFIGTLEGIGAYLVNTDRFLLGASIGGGGIGARNEDDDEDLYLGLGDLEGGFGVSVFGNVTTALADFGVSVTNTSGGDVEGLSGSIYASATLPASERLFFTLDISTTLAEEQIADAAFGVTAAQASRRASDIAGRPGAAPRRNLEPLRAFNPDGMLVIPAVGVSALYRLSERWTVLGSVNYTKLEGDAADSPLAPRDEDVSASVIFVRKMF